MPVCFRVTPLCWSIHTDSSAGCIHLHQSHLHQPNHLRISQITCGLAKYLVVKPNHMWTCRINHNSNRDKHIRWMHNQRPTLKHPKPFRYLCCATGNRNIAAKQLSPYKDALVWCDCAHLAAGLSNRSTLSKQCMAMCDHAARGTISG